MANREWEAACTGRAESAAWATSWVQSSPDWFAIAAVWAVAGSRILFRSHFLYDIDSVNFALGMRRFDPAAHQPHPPGYFLYVCLGRLVYHFFGDPNAALVAISIAASCGTSCLIYLLAREWYGVGPARISIVLFLFSPLCWFHGIVALTYVVEAFFSALVGLLCWRAYTQRRAYVLPASTVFALAAGFRPSTAMLLGPLWLASIWQAGRLRRWFGVIAAIAIVLAWFIPMTVAAGGAHRYLEAFAHLWSTVPGRRTMFANPFLTLARIFAIGWIFVLCFGTAALLVFGPPISNDPGSSAVRKRFITLWLTPGLLFFGLVFLNYVNSGYLLVLSPPVFAWLAARVQAYLAVPSRPRLRRLSLAAGIAVNCSIFLFAPIYCSYRSIRDFERELVAITGDFRSCFNPADTLIIGFDSHFLGYRHAGYYLPDFTTVQYPEVMYSDGPRVFRMQHDDTQVVRSFSLRNFRRFVLYPLPQGTDYSHYLQKVIALLPRTAVTTLRVGGRQVVTGPAWAIPLLFPTTAQSVD